MFYSTFSPFLYKIVLLDEDDAHTPAYDDLSSGLVKRHIIPDIKNLHIRFSTRIWELFEDMPDFHQLVCNLMQTMDKVEAIM